jgi:retinoid hydroxylase
MAAPSDIDDMKPPPRSLGQPRVGEARAFAADPISFLWKRYLELGPVFTTDLGMPHVFVIGPAAHQAVYEDFNDCLSAARAWPQYMQVMFGSHPYVLQDGAPMRRLKQLTSCAFREDTLAWTFERVMDAISRRLDYWAGGAPIRLFPEARSLVFEALWEWLAGPLPSDSSARDMLKGLHRHFTAVPHTNLWQRATPTLHDAMVARQQFRIRVFAKAMLEHQLERLLNERRRRPCQDVISLWDQARDKQGRGMSDSEIVAHSLLFLGVGVDTVASMLTWLLYALHRHARVREDLALEMASIPDSRPLRPDDLKQLTYTHALLKEVERVHPTTLGSARTVVKPFELEGYRFPTGWRVRTCTVVSHMLPEVFATPARFDPMRFMPPRSEQSARPYSLIGFGAGTRQCPGRPFASMFLSAFVSLALKGYEWDIPVGQDVSPVYHNWSVFIPAHQLRVRFLKRIFPSKKP